MSRMLVKSGVATAFVLVLLVAGFGTTVYASPSSGQPPKAVPNVAECTQFILTDKKTTNTSLDPKSGNG